MFRSSARSRGKSFQDRANRFHRRVRADRLLKRERLPSRERRGQLRRRARRDRRSAGPNCRPDLVRKASSHRVHSDPAVLSSRISPRPSIAGQPAARPVVPPQSRLLARIQQSRPGPPPAPGQPRPGPTRPGQPAPGQPIFRGPLRPGQGGPGRPGGPTPGAPSPGSPQMRGGRPQRHPTSPLGRIEPAAPPPTEPGRRHQAKPRPTGDIDRKRDMEGKLDGKFRPPKRQEVAPAADRSRNHDWRRHHGQGTCPRSSASRPAS